MLNVLYLSLFITFRIIHKRGFRKFCFKSNHHSNVLWKLGFNNTYASYTLTCFQQVSCFFNSQLSIFVTTKSLGITLRAFCNLHISSNLFLSFLLLSYYLSNDKHCTDCGAILLQSHGDHWPPWCPLIHYLDRQQNTYTMFDFTHFILISTKSSIFLSSKIAQGKLCAYSSFLIFSLPAITHTALMSVSSFHPMTFWAVLLYLNIILNHFLFSYKILHTEYVLPVKNRHEIQHKTKLSSKTGSIKINSWN